MSDHPTLEKYNVDSDVALMNQLPNQEIIGESPLHYINPHQMTYQPNQGQPITFKELKLLGYLVLRLDASNLEQVKLAESILGFPIPLSPLTSTNKNNSVVYWLSPDEWLIITSGQDTFNIESAFRQKMTGHYSLVNVSGGMTTIQLSGNHALDVLKKSSPIDFHIREFPIGKVVSTIFAKSSAIIYRLEEDTFRLVIRRSFADYIWLWLQDASLEYGLAIES